MLCLPALAGLQPGFSIEGFIHIPSHANAAAHPVSFALTKHPKYGIFLPKRCQEQASLQASCEECHTTLQPTLFCYFPIISLFPPSPTSPFLLTRYPLLPLCGLRVLCGSFPSVNRAICNPQSPDLSGVTTKTQKHEAAVTSSPLVSLCLRGSHDPQSAIANPSPRSLRLLPHIALDKISKIMYNPVKTSTESIHSN